MASGDGSFIDGHFVHKQFLRSSKTGKPLPPNWVVYTDPKTSSIYYYNVKTNESSWYFPGEVPGHEWSEDQQQHSHDLTHTHYPQPHYHRHQQQHAQVGLMFKRGVSVACGLANMPEDVHALPILNWSCYLLLDLISSPV